MSVGSCGRFLRIPVVAGPDLAFLKVCVGYRVNRLRMGIVGSRDLFGTYPRGSDTECGDLGWLMICWRWGESGWI